MKHLKYPLSLFVLLLLAKLIYIFIESGYNYDVLSVTTNSEISRQAIESLNDRGHTIASIGFTLLCIPLFYIFVRQKKIFTMWLSLAIFSVISFTSFHFSLNYLVDTVVEKNQDKRYEAYYTNLLKYGMIDGIIYYNSFIPRERLEKTNINDKILLTNIFLLSGSDNNLVDKFREKGEINTIELYLQKYQKDDYQEKFSQFKNLYSEVEDKWIEFNNEKKKLSKQLHDLNDDESIKNAFNKMDKQLTDDYKKYQEAYQNIKKVVAEKTSLKDLREMKESLNKYFKYQRFQKTKVSYREKMIERFGHFIEPKIWKNENGDITYQSITQVITEQIELKIKDKAFGLSSGLTKSAFINNKQIKIEVAKKLRKNDILIPANFDYSYAQFKKYYELMSYKKLGNVSDKFSQELEKRIGGNDLKLGTNWKGFIYSNYLYESILKRIESSNIKDISLYQKVLLSRNLENFKTVIYMPKALSLASESIIHEKSQFKNNEKIADKGDQAIKLLYIPPIALGLSIVALLLNIVTVVGMLLQLFLFRSALITGLIQIALITVILLIPLVFKADNLQNNMLSKTTNPMILSALQWASYWERANFLLHKKGGI